MSKEKKEGKLEKIKTRLDFVSNLGIIGIVGSTRLSGSMSSMPALVKMVSPSLS